MEKGDTIIEKAECDEKKSLFGETDRWQRYEEG